MRIINEEKVSVTKSKVLMGVSYSSGEMYIVATQVKVTPERDPIYVGQIQYTNKENAEVAFKNYIV